MGWKTVRIDTSDVWTLCRNNSIDANNLNEFDAWVSSGWGVTVYDSRSGAGTPDQRFLLVSPDLSNKYFSRLLTLVRKKLLTCGFEVREARAYQTVYVVDPNGDFSDPELAPLSLDGTTVKKVPGDTPAELAQNLEALIG